MKNHNTSLNLGLLLIRLMLATVFIYHGWDKIFGEHGVAGFAKYLENQEVPSPMTAAWAASLAELVGGISLLTGIWMRLLCIPLAFTMYVAAFMTHGHAFSIQNKPPGMEYALTLAVVVTGLALTGPGRFAFKLSRRKED